MTASAEAPPLSEPWAPDPDAPDALRGQVFLRRFAAPSPACPTAGLRYHTVRVLCPSAGADNGPVCYMLDGDAVVDTLAAEPALWDRARGSLIVAIGHAGDTPARKAARAFDYTPPLPGATDQRDPRVPGWHAGGAADFLAFILGTLRPAVNRAFGTAARRQWLYGHSYGGLFVLYALSRQSDAFDAYVAASPSIWWQDGFIAAEIERFAARRATAEHARPARVSILVGAHEAWHRHPTGPDGQHASRTGGAPTADAARTLASRLAQCPALLSEFDEIADGTHGNMLSRSLGRTLTHAGGA